MLRIDQRLLRQRPNVCVLGSDGRGHQLTKSLSGSTFLQKIGGRVLFAPGNGSVAEQTQQKLDPNDFEQILRLARDQSIGLIVASSEEPIAQGLGDFCRLFKIPFFGPSQAAAKLEWSKVFTKHRFRKWNIPTAQFMTASTVAQAHRAVRKMIRSWGPIVIKADGLAAGKGVELPDSLAEAFDVIDRFMVKKVHGKAGEAIVVERRLPGAEYSMTALSDGKNICFLPGSRDHKRRYADNREKNPNTGGMGAMSPVPDVSDDVVAAMRAITRRIIAQMRHEKVAYRGVLYVGFMLTPDGPKVLECNCRLGDPETGVILPRLHPSIDIFELLLATTRGSGLKRFPEILPTIDDVLVAIALVSDGYPGAYVKGDEITDAGMDTSESWIIHAGTAWKGGKLVTNGGRVMYAVGRGKTLFEARQHALDRAAQVNFTGKCLREDIGLERLAA